MTKRILLNKFRFYVRLGTIPILVVGILFLFYPSTFFLLLKELNFNTLDNFLLRLIGIFLIFAYLTFEYMISNPNYHRELAFLQSLLLIGIAFLFILFVFVWKFSYYFLIVSVYTIIISMYLLMFASKNLLVRD